MKDKESVSTKCKSLCTFEIDFLAQLWNLCWNGMLASSRVCTPTVEQKS